MDQIFEHCKGLVDVANEITVHGKTGERQKPNGDCNKVEIIVFNHQKTSKSQIC